MMFELYMQDVPVREIARRMGYKSSSSVSEQIRKAIDERGIHARQKAWDRADQVAEKVRRQAEALMDFYDESGAPAAPQALTAVATVLTAYDKHYGLAPGEYITMTHDGEVKVTVADQKRDAAIRLMLGLDALDLDGVGSGRSPEDQLAALSSAGDVVDAEIVVDDPHPDDLDDLDDDNAYDLPLASDDDAGEIPGRWVEGKFIPFWNDEPTITNPDSQLDDPL